MRLLIAVAAAGLAALFAGPAQAATCSYPASAYSAGAPFDVTSPGAQPVNDPIFPDQWGLTQIKAPAAWARGDRGLGATIAVVDTGADLAHPDLAANLVAGTDVTPADDQGCPGAQDENGHGTHVAGIAAAVTDNGIGVAGTAPAAKVMPVRVLDADGEGDDATVIAGIKYAADHGAKVINLSLGGAPIIGEAPPLNEEIAKAAEYAFSKGSLLVAAAGNESIPLCSYPAAAANTICVGATDRRGVPSAYSNFPVSPEDNVGVRAPGGVGSSTLLCEDSEDIWSTLWPGGDPCAGTGSLSGYDTFAGTSMASPYVSGVAALLSAKGLTNSQILECISTTSSNGGNYDPAMGYGIVDADNATKTCSRATTPDFGGTSGTAGGTATSTPPSFLKVSARRTKSKRRIRVTIKSSKSVRVKLRVVARKRTLGRKTVRLKKAGTKRSLVRVKKHRKRAKTRVRWSGGGRKGVVRVRR